MARLPLPSLPTAGGNASTQYVKGRRSGDDAISGYETGSQKDTILTAADGGWMENKGSLRLLGVWEPRDGDGTGR